MTIPSLDHVYAEVVETREALRLMSEPVYLADRLREEVEELRDEIGDQSDRVCDPERHELADVFILTVAIAEARGIDIGAAVLEKLQILRYRAANRVAR